MSQFDLNILKTEGLLLLVDKPLHWTSFDVVNKLRYKLRDLTGDKKIKVGHAGTLDPLATGLLIVCVGKKTKAIDSFMGLDKMYTGTFTFGASTPSYDLETAPENFTHTDNLSLAQLQNIALNFNGDLQQKPPIYSAIKKDGKPLYLSAREGIEVETAWRSVRINRFDILNFEEDKADFVVDCSKGTYIRSLAHDFGLACDNRAYLSKLVRTKIGEYDIKNALSVDELIAHFETK